MDLKTSLKKKYSMIVSYMGLIWAFDGVAMLMPLLIIPFYKEEIVYAKKFFIPALLLMVCGIIIWLTTRKKEMDITLRDGGTIVVLVWITTILASSVPFLMMGGMNFTQSVFEATSGWTTTGLSVMDVEQTPHIYLFWRSLMQLLGGVGIAVIVLASIIGPMGTGLYNAEGRSDLLLPNITKSAKLIMSIYLGYTVVGTVLLTSVGMPLFDSVNHAMAALSTGGFTTASGSIGEYDNLLIELVTIILMLAGTINFGTHYLILKGEIRIFAKQSETKFMLLLLALMAPFVIFISLRGIYGNIGQSIRVGIFNLVSALSTTGFSTVDYSGWPHMAFLIMIVFMIVGGGTGSTAGGIKQFRIYILLRIAVKNIRGFVLPMKSVQEIEVYRPEGRIFIQEKEELRTANFVFMYMILYLTGVIIFTAYGVPLKDALFEFASTLGTVGLSIGVTSADAPGGILWTQIVGMLLGRLEILIIFYAGIKFTKDLGAMFSKNIKGA